VIGTLSAKQHGKVEKPRIEIERVYDDSGRKGALVERLWPRGVKKEALDMDEWAEDVALSSDLRKWYGHDPERFATPASSRRYRRELAGDLSAPMVGRLYESGVDCQLTLLTAARDLELSGAMVPRKRNGGGR
jgi:uncharacterized protein YeaO (DUF488 family)